MLSHDQRTHSPSPSRTTLFGEKLSAIGAKLSRTFSHDEEARDLVGKELHSPRERSTSRGREALHSTGRGGFGNIRGTSVSRDRTDGPDDFSPTRGREPVSSPTLVYSTGRGGAGNIRSPSRDATRGPSEEEKNIIEQYAAATHDTPVSVGRGGLGNINRSRSRDPGLGGADRSRSRDPVLAPHHLSTGRGGVGNIRADVEGGYAVNMADEVERKGMEHEGGVEGLHSTGRGGFANITEKEEPVVERPSLSLADGHSTGRGGSGNIHTRN